MLTAMQLKTHAYVFKNPNSAAEQEEPRMNVMSALVGYDDLLICLVKSDMQ